ncbi:hypothetical protein [Acholeplasma hippikon]|uniref:Lipoprotein n=1 Tax=Acholeplasma hippikon TaxID=264636 RepID=A0A449BI28_9MOLU|nr:hypothetical protein [Acholeplasma hippikon]VEU82106.1 Uncharacterised protein [Acholeplasma hippikon]
MKKIIIFALTITTLLFMASCNMFTSTTGLSIELPDKVEYTLGESFDSKGLVVYAHRSNGGVLTLS